MTPGSGGERPAHTVLLAAGIPIVEHLTGLEELPPTGARFTAAPPRVAGFGTFPVRAYASVPADRAARPPQVRRAGCRPQAGEPVRRIIAESAQTGAGLPMMAV